MVEKEKDMNIKWLRFDGRGIFFSNEFSEYLKEQKIQKKYSCSYSLHQNGVVKRKNMHFIKITHAMLNEMNLPNYFWIKIIIITIYIMNQTPTTVVHGMTFKITSKKPNVSHFILFGCIAYMHVLNEKKSILDPKAEKCIFIEYSLE
jgi:hypothetical protein